MALHHHSDRPWRVRVDDAAGDPCGAGVLLDDRHVLTCAHVVRYAGAAPGSGAVPGVRVSSVACRPEWTRTARVAPGTWVHDHDTQRGDVALLELDEPAGCGTRTTLWKAPSPAERSRCTASRRTSRSAWGRTPGWRDPVTGRASGAC